MKIYFGTDHAGFDLKEKLIPFVRNELGYNVEDLGAFKMEEKDDYPDWISLVAKEIAIDPYNARGIVLGGSGQGEAIVANKYRGVRAVVYNGTCNGSDTHALPEDHEIYLSRQHNDSNILSLGARFLDEESAKEAVKLWLTTPFSAEERHVRRLEKLAKIEMQNLKE